MKYVETGRGPPTEAEPEGEHLSLKEQKELFGMVRGYQDSVRKQNAKAPPVAPGFENYKEALDRFVAVEEERERGRQRREAMKEKRAMLPVIDGISPPPDKHGRPTKAEAEHRRKYAEAQRRQQERASEGEGLQSRLQAAGYGE